MNDAELDALFAQAREETEADRGSAERFLSRHRANLAAATDRSPRGPDLTGKRRSSCSCAGTRRGCTASLRDWWARAAPTTCFRRCS